MAYYQKRLNIEHDGNWRTTPILTARYMFDPYLNGMTRVCTRYDRGHNSENVQYKGGIKHVNI